MKIKRTIEGKEVEIELTEDELYEACKRHLAKTNEAYIRGFIDEDEDFEHLTPEEKEDIIKAIAYDMVDHVSIDYGDYDVFYECSEDYRDSCDDDEYDEDDADDFGDDEYDD